MTAAETGPARIVHVSGAPWDPSRPPALVICCVDGRWFRHIEEFVRDSLKAGHRTDWLCVPGGVEPLTLLDFVPKDFNFMRRRLEGLVQKGEVRDFAEVFFIGISLW